MKKILSHSIAAISGLWVSTLLEHAQIKIFPDSNFFGFIITADWQILLIIGTTLGLINYFARPILNIIAFPLKIITFGLFGFFIQALTILATDMIFREIDIPLFWPFFWTVIIIVAFDNIISQFILKD
jgi:putative membrane protein